MLTVTTRFDQGGRRHLAVNQNWKTKRWVLQWATATRYGHSFATPLPGDYPTKKAALAAKRDHMKAGR